MYWISIWARECSRSTVRGFYVTPSKIIARDQDTCKISRNNAAQGKELKLDSNETVVSECAYLPVVCEVEVISHRWVFCCQCVDLYGRKRTDCDLASARSFLHAGVLRVLFSLFPFLLLFLSCYFPITSLLKWNFPYPPLLAKALIL